jgi:peptide/nickel transport system substrate-binding protein
MQRNSVSSRGSSRLGHRLQRVMPVVVAVILASAFAADTPKARSTSGPTLVVDNSFALDTLDPQRAFDPTSSLVLRATFDTLFTFEGDDLAHPVPLLVRNWTSRGDRRFTFSLRQGVRFADGTALTSADVVFSLRRLVNLKGNPSFLLAGDKISARDQQTVVLTTPTPEPQLPSILANPATGIVNAKLAALHGATDGANAATTDTAEQWFNSPDSAGAGSGPYVLQSYEATSQVVLRANTNYWGNRPPPFGAIVIRNMQAPAQLLNIRRGAHQIAIDLSSTQAATLRGDAGVDVSVRPSTDVLYAYMNDDPNVSSVTSNPVFQQAVRQALDYKSLAALAGPGAIQAPGMIPSMLFGALPQADDAKQDLSEAKADFAASGAGNEQVTLEYPSNLTINGVSFASLAQRMQTDLSAAGLNVELAGSPVTTAEVPRRPGGVRSRVLGPRLPRSRRLPRVHAGSTGRAPCRVGRR